jgi:outer membrane receptor protein involved in Fe transport
MNKVKWFLLFLAGVIFLPLQLQADENKSTSDTVAEEGLEFLLFNEIPVVSIASKSKEEYLTSSGTVYTITDKEIAQYGWRDLKEILASLPNMDYKYDWNWFQGGLRGFSGNSNGIIIMIDGREFNTLWSGEAYFTNDFPAQRIKRVEILMGPNSTLYGSNATQGIINVITKVAGEDQKDTTELEYVQGQVNTQIISGLFRKSTENTDIGFSASSYRSDQDYDELAKFNSNTVDYSRSPSVDGIRDLNTHDFNNFEKNYTIDAYGRYKDVYGGYNKYMVENTAGMENVEYYSASKVPIREMYTSYLGYKHNFNEKTSAYIEYQHSHEECHFMDPAPLNLSTADSFSDILFDISTSFWNAKRDRILTQGNFSLGEINNFIAGIDYYKFKMDISADGGFVFPQKEAAWAQPVISQGYTNYDKISYFLQDDIKFSDSIKLDLGARFNKQDFVEDSWTPRACLVYEIVKDSVIKLNYGKGFRAPAVFDLFGVITNEAPVNEMDMYELNYSQKSEIGSLQLINVLSVYQMKSTDSTLVAKSAVVSSPEDFITMTSSHKIDGLEDLLKFQYKKLGGFLGFRWIDPDKIEVAGQNIIAEVPITKIKLGLTYQFFESLQSAIFVDHWDKVKSDANTIDGTGTEVLTVPAWTTVNLNILYRGLEFEGMKPDLSFYVENLLDETYYHANTRGLSPIQYLQAPRNFRFKISLKY